MADYPLPVFHFQVEWGGSKLGFSEVSGLSIEQAPIEYRDGASLEFTKLKMPGMRTYGNITLKRGIIKQDNEFFDWLNTTRMNTIERRDLVISLLDEEHAPVMVWKVKNAWPSKIDSPSLQADGNDVAIESMEIAHEGVVIENG